MAEPIPLELPNSSYALAGEPPDELVYVRSDDPDPEEPHRWYAVLGYETDPVTWHEVCQVRREDPETGEERWVPRPVEELVPRAEVDRLVAEAVARVGARPVGRHLRETGGYCGHCGSQHSPTEWARLEDRLDEEEVFGG